MYHPSKLLCLSIGRQRKQACSNMTASNSDFILGKGKTQPEHCDNMNRISNELPG